MASQWNDQSSDGFFGRCPPLNSGFPLGNELGSENTHFFRKTIMFCLPESFCFNLHLSGPEIAVQVFAEPLLFDLQEQKQISLGDPVIQRRGHLIHHPSWTWADPVIFKSLGIEHPQPGELVEHGVCFFCSSGITKICGPIHPVHPSFYQRGGGSALKKYRDCVQKWREALVDGQFPRKHPAFFGLCKWSWTHPDPLNFTRRTQMHLSSLPPGGQSHRWVTYQNWGVPIGSFNHQRVSRLWFIFLL